MMAELPASSCLGVKAGHGRLCRGEEWIEGDGVGVGGPCLAAISSSLVAGEVCSFHIYFLEIHPGLDTGHKAHKDLAFKGIQSREGS